MLLSKGSSGSGGDAAAASSEGRETQRVFKKPEPKGQYKICLLGQTGSMFQDVSQRVSNYRMKEKKCGLFCKCFKRFLKGWQIYSFTHADKDGLWWGISYDGRLRYPQKRHTGAKSLKYQNMKGNQSLPANSKGSPHCRQLFKMIMIQTELQL